MALDVEKKVKMCGRCVCQKALPEKVAPLVNINPTRPLELLCMDFLSLEPDTSGTKDILIITDNFTKFAVAISTANQKARTVARCGTISSCITDSQKDFIVTRFQVSND